MPQRHPHVFNLDGPRRYRCLVQSKIIGARPPAITRPLHKPFPHGIQVLQQAMPSPSGDGPAVRTALTSTTSLVPPGGFGASKQLTQTPPVTASKPVKAYIQLVGPQLIWLKRNRLEYLDEARIGSSWDKPTDYCIANVGLAQTQLLGVCDFAKRPV
jgi:hypothetical protein